MRQHGSAVSQRLVSSRFGGACRPCLAAVPAIAMLCGVAQAALAEGAANSSRYTLQEVAAGYLRLDHKSGQISHCREQQAGWVCRLVADDRTTLLSEIDRLRKENAGLRNRKSTAKSAPPPTPPASNSARAKTKRLKTGHPGTERPKTKNRDTAAPQPPASDDGEKVMALVQRMIRRFVTFARRLRRELEGAG